MFLRGIAGFCARLQAATSFSSMCYHPAHWFRKVTMAIKFCPYLNRALVSARERHLHKSSETTCTIRLPRSGNTADQTDSHSFPRAASRCLLFFLPLSLSLVLVDC